MSYDGFRDRIKKLEDKVNCLTCNGGGSDLPTPLVPNTYLFTDGTTVSWQPVATLPEPLVPNTYLFTDGTTVTWDTVDTFYTSDGSIPSPRTVTISPASPVTFSFPAPPLTSGHLFNFTTGTIGVQFIRSNDNIIGKRNVVFTNTGFGGLGVPLGLLATGTSASGNTLIGTFAGQLMNVAVGNTYVGYGAGNNINTGSLNVAIGYQSDYVNEIGERRIVIGANAGSVDTDGNNVILIGERCAQSLLGNSHLIIGDAGAGNNSSGTRINGFGYGAARSLVNSNNVYLFGNTTGAASRTINNAFVVHGHGADKLNVLINKDTDTGAEFQVQGSGHVHTGTASAKETTAAFQIDSLTGGLLPPRMTSFERTTMVSPAIGLIVYQTDDTTPATGVEGLYVYKSTGWVQIT